MAAFLRAFLVALFLPVQVQAFEIFGKCFGSSCQTEAVENDDLIDPKMYDLEFRLVGEGAGIIDEAVRPASELWRGREGAVSGSAGLISRAKGDYRRLLASLYLEGYYAGTISIQINGQEAADLPLGTELTRRSAVLVIVDTGAVYRFGSFQIENRAPTPINEDDVVKPPKNFMIAPGDIARAGQVKSAASLVVQEWQQQGYPKAKVTDRNVRANHTNRELNVTLTVDPGQKASYGELTVSGTEKLDPEFLAYMADIQPGEEYDPDDIVRAEKRLDRLDVLNSRKIKEAHQLADYSQLPFELQVSEKKQRRIGLGATLSSTDGIGLEGYWLHRNLFGQAERLRLEAQIGGLGETFEADELDYGVAATYTKPGVFSPDIDWITRIFAEREFNDTFEGETAGGSSVLNFLYSDNITISGGGFVEYSNFEDAFGDRDFLTAGFTGSVTYDGRDDKLDPTRGFYADFKVKPFHEFEFANTGVRLDAEVRGYVSLDVESRTVLAGRVRLGSLLGVQRNETPASFLYFAGGGGSVRGFGFNNIGVVEPNGDISGGRSRLEASVELRHRVNDQLGVVGFVDAGTVSPDGFVDFSEDLRVSAGAGIRYYTGLGPIRLDVAVPLNPKNGDPDFGVFAGIGQAF